MLISRPRPVLGNARLFHAYLLGQTFSSGRATQLKWIISFVGEPRLIGMVLWFRNPKLTLGAVAKRISSCHRLAERAMAIPGRNRLVFQIIVYSSENCCPLDFPLGSRPSETQTWPFEASPCRAWPGQFRRTWLEGIGPKVLEGFICLVRWVRSSFFGLCLCLLWLVGFGVVRLVRLVMLMFGLPG